MSRDYRKLRVFQAVDEIARDIYKLTKSFPREEQFGITSQLRRSALAVPTNIVEGSHRSSLADYIRFLDIAVSSLAESRYLLEFAQNLGYAEKNEANRIRSIQNENIGALISLIASLRKKLSK